MNKPTTSKYCDKPYLGKCGHTQMIGTNHFGSVYMIRCKTCGQTSEIWQCQLPCPENMEKPDEWKICKLGDICEIIQGMNIK
jgi:hypothetical protein